MNPLRAGANILQIICNNFEPEIRKIEKWNKPSLQKLLSALLQSNVRRYRSTGRITAVKSLNWVIDAKLLTPCPVLLEIFTAMFLFPGLLNACKAESNRLSANSYVQQLMIPSKVF